MGTKLDKNYMVVVPSGVLSEIFSIYEENENIHKKIIESENIEEVRNAYDSMYWEIASTL